MSSPGASAQAIDWRTEVANARAAYAKGGESRTAALAEFHGIGTELFEAVRTGDGPTLDWELAVTALHLLENGVWPDGVHAGEFCLLATESAGRVPGWGRNTGLMALHAAKILLRLGDVESMLACVDLGLAFEQDAYLTSLLWTTRAQSLRWRGRWDESLAATGKAQRFAAEIEGRDGLYAHAFALGERAQTLMDQGALAPAERALEQERLLAGQSKLKESLSRTTWHQAQFRLASGDYRQAYAEIKAQRDGDEFAAHSEMTRAFLLSMSGIALGELARRDPANAARYFELARADLRAARAIEAMGALESLRVDLYLAEHALAEGSRERCAQELASAGRRLAAAAKDPGGAGGLEVLEYGALACALETRLVLGGESTRKHLLALDARFDRSFRAFLDSWAEGRPTADVGYLKSNARRTILAQRLSLTLALGGPSVLEQAFGELLATQALGSIVRTSASEAPDLAALRADLIRPGHGLLIYAPGPSGGHVFAVDDKRIVHEQLDPENGLWDSCRALNRSLRLAVDESGAGLAAQLEAEAKTLSGLLLPGKIAPAVANWSALTVIGSGFFLDIPFEFLRDGEGRLLGETKALDALPTAALGSVLARREAPVRAEIDLALLIGLTPGEEVQAARPDLLPIRVASRELERLTRAFDQRTRITPNLTPSGLEDASLARVPIVHLMAHGIYEVSLTNAGATLVLDSEEGRDGFFRRGQVRELSLSGVVLLSVCGAARGPAYWGNDDLANLAGAFLATGARCVVLPRDRVTYRDAIAFMERVTDELASGATPAEAARRARADLGGPPASPVTRARLALFQVVGLGQEPALVD